MSLKYVYEIGKYKHIQPSAGFLWAFKMQRRQLKIRIGTQLIMPSGKAAKCLKIDGDEFTFQYLQGWGKFVLSRNAIISMMPEQVA